MRRIAIALREVVDGDRCSTPIWRGEVMLVSICDGPTRIPESWELRLADVDPVHLYAVRLDTM